MIWLDTRRPSPSNTLASAACWSSRLEQWSPMIWPSGRELWRIDWRTNYDCNASTPTVFDDKLFISTGYGGHRARGALFQLGDDQPRQIWLNQDLETRMNSCRSV